MNTRQVFAAWAAIALVVVGLVMRAHAEEWSRNVVRRDGVVTVTTDFDRGRYSALQDVGATLAGFGVVLAAMLVAQWAVETKRAA